MYSPRIGYLGYKLYMLGWQSGVHRHLSPLQHVLFSSLRYYRQGFAEGLKYLEAYYCENINQ